MAASFLKAADLTTNQFLEVVEGLVPLTSNSVSRRIWLEAADGWAFDWWQGVEHSFRWYGAGRELIEDREGARDYLARSIAGRLFAPDGELRWRIVPALGDVGYRAIFLGKTDWVGSALDDCSDSLTGLKPTQHRYFLWGKQTGATPEEWIELRIPHRFRYPVSGNCRNVKAVVEQWRDDIGELHFFRLCDLEPTGGQSDA